MAKTSAGILPFRKGEAGVAFLLGHMGGPFWANKDKSAWTIFKGEIPEGEAAEETARREYREETGFELQEPLIELQPIRQSGGKVVYAWAMETDVDPDDLVSNEFELEWPPKSGKKEQFPEINRAAWFTLAEAEGRIIKAQLDLLREVLDRFG